MGTIAIPTPTALDLPFVTDRFLSVPFINLHSIHNKRMIECTCCAPITTPAIFHSSHAHGHQHGDREATVSQHKWRVLIAQIWSLDKEQEREDQYLRAFWLVSVAWSARAHKEQWSSWPCGAVMMMTDPRRNKQWTHRMRFYQRKGTVFMQMHVNV